MITITKTIRVINGKTLAEISGLSTDTKPTDVATNSLFFELNTGDFYYFDGTTWQKVGA